MRLSISVALAIVMLSVLELSMSKLSADQATHRDGRIFDGKMVPIAKIAEDPERNPDPNVSRPIFLIDDNLTQTMIPVKMLSAPIVPKGDSYRKILITQEVSTGRSSVARVGGIVAAQDFDTFGRRTIEINTGAERVKIIQGITEITPLWTKVKGLKAGVNVDWDMRIATSSIPRQILSQIILRSIKDPKDFNQRVAIVELYMRAERYPDALYELEQIKKDFPDNEAIPKVLDTLRKLSTQVFLKEVDTRREAGQFQIAYSILQRIPTENLPGTVLQQIRQSTEEMQTKEDQRKKIVEELKTLVLSLPADSSRGEWQDIVDEIARDMTLNTLDRLSPYWNFREDKELKPTQKLSLAATGWIIGSAGAQSYEKIALSLIQTRNLVRDYLRIPAAQGPDEGIFSRIVSEEANTPDLLTKVVTHMKPVFPLPELKPDSDVYNLEVPGQPGLVNYNYQVLLPPEYDPYRSYPVIVCLHGRGMTPTHELDWWGGSPGAKGRFGHAARYGYIVIAPQYLDVGKFNYEGTALEHDKVTRCLRDASRRFNIDSDRVFLSGHSIGGDAAWDIGLSHPDLWAGVIPINAKAFAPTVNSYLSNAASVPMYFINGELEGEVLKNNSLAWDKYFLYGHDVTLVKFLGRGSESFSDEILRLFGWMEKKNRFKDFRLQPKKFKVTTKRTTDNYFWAVEVNSFNSLNASLAKSVEIEGEFKENYLRVSAPGKATIWLSPDVMNFSQPMQIFLNGKALIDKKMASPSIRVLLEDVRKRGERRHPFWVMLDGN